MSDVDDSIWNTMTELRGFAEPGTAMERLLALIALRKVLETRGRIIDDDAPLEQVLPFGDLVLAANLPDAIARATRVIGRVTRAREDVAEAIELLLDLKQDRNDRALDIIVRDVAALPRDVVLSPTIASALERAFVRATGKDGLAGVAGDNVLRLMVALSDLQPEARICDPCCGLGLTLLATASARPVDGADANRRTTALARLLLLAGGVRANIEATDVLLSPATRQVGPYDAVLTIPPINRQPPAQLDGGASDRFRFGTPTRHADWLYVQHALSQLAPEGTAVLLLGQGALFRGGAEAAVRRGIIEADFVDAAIALPSGMLRNTSVPTALLVLRRTRARGRQGKVLLVDIPSSIRGEDRKPDLAMEIVEAVTQAVRSGEKSSEVRSRTVSREELAATDYSLLPSKYLELTPVDAQRSRQAIQNDLQEAIVAEAACVEQMNRALEALVAATATSKPGA